MTTDQAPDYRLGRTTTGGAILGLSGPQILLLAAGIAALALLPATTRSALGLATGVVVALGCAGLALARIDAEPLYRWIPVLARFVLLSYGGRSVWMAPLPLLTGTPPSSSPPRPYRWRKEPSAPVLPRCLRGLELLAVERPAWAGAHQTLTPVGLVHDRRRSTLTVLMEARGTGFALLDPSEQHAGLHAWGQVLAQFGREVSPVIRLGWTLWSAPTAAAHDSDHAHWLAQHSSDSPQLDDVRTTYATLLNDSIVQRHDLRIWITVFAYPPRPTRADATTTRRSRPGPADTALEAAKALAERCHSAGLIVSAPLSPVQIAEATRTQADPTLAARPRASGRDLAQHIGIASALNGSTPSATGEHAAVPTSLQTSVSPVAVAPMAVEARWDAVHVDGAWHRAFWIGHWPGMITDPGWLHPLLTTFPGIRTLAISYEPIAPGVSRRKITADAVALDSHLSVRERHDLRVPVGLQHAHQDIDQREAELAAGHAEVALLALLVLTETSREALDTATRTLLDQAAHAGITDLRPLHARHDAAWACTLPLGRVPDQELLHGLPG